MKKVAITLGLAVMLIAGLNTPSNSQGVAQQQQKQKLYPIYYTADQIRANQECMEHTTAPKNEYDIIASAFYPQVNSIAQKEKHEADSTQAATLAPPIHKQK